MSISNYLENAIMDVVFNGGTLVVPATYIKLHVGDPGDNGTANVAGETTRKLATWTAASGGQVVTEADLVWNPVATTETYSHISVWDASTGGNHLWCGELLASFDVNGGDSFTLPAATVVVTLS